MKGAAYLRYAACAVFLAACAWTLAFFMAREQSPETVTARRVGTELAITAEGFILRDECVVYGDESARLTHKTGDRVTGGSVLAVTEDGESIYAPCGGIFSSLVDGYEGAAPEDIHSAEPASVEGALGRIVSGGWCFAAETAEFDKLRQGQSVLLSLPEKCAATVVSVENGRIVLRCRAGLESVVNTRRTVFRISLSETQGIKVPEEALHCDADGLFVYVLRAGIPERCGVELLLSREDYCLVREGELRENMQIIIK